MNLFFSNHSSSSTIIQRQRYYYTDSKSFEQSLDVYKPIVEQPCDVSSTTTNKNKKNDTTSTESSSLPMLVVLVVGSAWVGHHSFIYSLTSWWNSAGPQAVARQGGCVTVCIRHRGSFPRLGELLLQIGGLSWLLSNTMVLLVLIVGATLPLLQALSSSSSSSLDDVGEEEPAFNSSYLYRYPAASIVTEVITDAAASSAATTGPGTTTSMALMLLLLGTVFILLMILASQGAADFDEMLNDVADALAWVEKHKDSEILSLTTTSNSSSKDDDEPQQQQQQSDNNPASRIVVFGGYSSGGHVAATVLQRPHLFTARNLPTPDQFCQAALFLSGILAVRPLVTPTTAKEAAAIYPHKQQQMAVAAQHHHQQPPPRWLTDLLTLVVFGQQGASQLPSPLHNLIHNNNNNNSHQIHKKTNSSSSSASHSNNHNHHPRIPHLLIGCQTEVFGLTWLDVFFCSAQFCHWLQRADIPAKWVAVPSDHWNILASRSLRRVLRQELEWVLSTVQKQQKQKGILRHPAQ